MFPGYTVSQNLFAVGEALLLAFAVAALAGLILVPKGSGRVFSMKVALPVFLIALIVAMFAVMLYARFGPQQPQPTVASIPVSVPAVATPEPTTTTADDTNNFVMNLGLVVIGLALSLGIGAAVSGLISFITKRDFSFKTMFITGGIAFILGTVLLLGLRNFAIARQQELAASGQISQPAVAGGAQTQTAAEPTKIPAITPEPTREPVRTPIPDVAISGLKLSGPDEVELKKIAVFTATVSSGTNLIYSWYWNGNPAAGNERSVQFDTQTAKPGVHLIEVRVSNGVSSATAKIELEVYDPAPWRFYVEDAKKAVPDATIDVTTLRKISKSFPNGLYYYVNSADSGGLLPHPAVGRVLDQAARAKLNAPEGGVAYISGGHYYVISKHGYSEFPWEKDTVQLALIFGVPDDESNEDRNTTLELFGYPVGHIYVTQLAPEQGQKLGKAVLNGPWLAQQIWWGLRGSSNCGVGCAIVALSAWDLNEHAAVTWIITTDKNYNLKWVLRDSWTPGK